ncbi:MAG: AraC family transcriptional regulator [Spirochaetaceae bacterium]
MEIPLIDPIDYFSGESWQGTLPENVLLYTRLERIALDNKNIHHHSRYNIIMSLEGSCRILLDDQIFYIPAHCVLLIHPWQTFRFLYDENRPIKWIFLSFDWNNIKNNFKHNSVKMASKSILAYIDSIINRYNKVGTGSWIVPYLMILLEEYPLLLDSNIQSVTVKDEQMNLILKIQKYIHEHKGEDISVSKIATFCSYSNSRIRTIFRDNMGTSIGVYVREIKMNSAAIKLRLSELSITEIADLCGFSSVYSFSRGFTNLYGVSPKKYRQQTLSLNKDYR